MLSTPSVSFRCGAVCGVRGWLEWSAVALLLIFVAILVALNFFFGEMGYGVHISIFGSLALTFIVSPAMNALSNRR